MNFPVQHDELTTLQYLITNYFPAKDAAQAQAVLSRLVTGAAIEAHGVPDGWQLVPVEMTHDMLRAPDYRRLVAARAGVTERRYAARQKDWEAILLAAPPAPQAEPAPAGSGGWEAHAKALEHELAYWKQRAQTMHEPQKGECWYWQGDGNDHTESMVNSLPVVIRADALRALMAPQASEVQQEPLGFISPKQVERIAGPEGEFGAYIPMRKTPAGNFTLAVYTHPATQAKPQPLSDEQLKQMLAAEYNRGWNDCEATHDGP